MRGAIGPTSRTVGGSSMFGTSARRGKLSLSQTRRLNCWSLSLRIRLKNQNHETALFGSHVSSWSATSGLLLLAPKAWGEECPYASCRARPRGRLCQERSADWNRNHDASQVFIGCVESV